MPTQTKDSDEPGKSRKKLETLNCISENLRGRRWENFKVSRTLTED